MKRRSLWERGDTFASKNIEHAKRIQDTRTGLWEYLRFSYMAGWAAAMRHKRYQLGKSGEHGG